MTTPTTSLKLEADTKERLDRLATARLLSAHWLMREAIEQYLNREEARERFKNDALSAWSDYRRSGKHVPGEEADGWLARLEAGQDCDPPMPHG